MIPIPLGKHDLDFADNTDHTDHTDYTDHADHTDHTDHTDHIDQEPTVFALTDVDHGLWEWRICFLSRCVGFTYLA